MTASEVYAMNPEERATQLVRSLVDGYPLEEVSRIYGADVHHIEYRAIGRHLDVEVPSAASAAGQVCGAAAVDA